MKYALLVLVLLATQAKGQESDTTWNPPILPVIDTGFSRSIGEPSKVIFGYRPDGTVYGEFPAVVESVIVQRWREYKAWQKAHLDTVRTIIDYGGGWRDTGTWYLSDEPTFLGFMNWLDDR